LSELSLQGFVSFYFFYGFQWQIVDWMQLDRALTVFILGQRMGAAGHHVIYAFLGSKHAISIISYPLKQVWSCDINMAAPMKGRPSLCKIKLLFLHLM